MARAVGATVFSRKVWTICRTLIVDVLAQWPIARQSKVRWLMHVGLFYGVVLLVLLHALDELILADWTTDYASTLNPYMALRNVLGFLMAVALVAAWAGRRRNPVLKRFTSASDRWLLVLLAVILISGITLEASQIISAPVFDEMVADYWGSEDAQEIEPLKAFWARRFAVVFKSPVDGSAESIAAGEELHIAYCADCHSPPRSAFMAYPLARAARPVAPLLNRMRVDLAMWYLHFIAGCLALALVPFGKFFHLVSVPVSLVVRAVADAIDTSPENRSTRRAMGVDACTHCGVCSQHCSVAPIMTAIENPSILPSEKIGQVDRMARCKLSLAELRRLAQGSDICTACGRCTDVCPSGIDLQDLWLASEADLHASGYRPPHGWIRTRSMAQWADQAKEDQAAGAEAEKRLPGPKFTGNPDTFRECVQCTTCTTVCPVVAASENPKADLDMTPQQVMNLMRLELKAAALGCRMVWDCVTCYKCQEHCPQGVPVADVLYELRNEACRRLNPDTDRAAQTRAERGTGNPEENESDADYAEASGLERMKERP